jgi:hypothetical protein
MNRYRAPRNGKHAPGPKPEQGELSLGVSHDPASFQSRLERRLCEDPELLERLADAAKELGEAR